MRTRYLWLTVFAVAMAYLESAVVVYLRELYYPQGFEFPLVVIPTRLAAIEIGREVATVMMLLAVARLGVRGFWPAFAGFMFLFGIWDILYYAWLKVFLGWPGSLLDWDVLFLIPVPWTGPVLAPVLVSLSLVAASLAVESALARGRALRVTSREWAGLVAGGLVVVASFVVDWREIVSGAEPRTYPWWLFAAGECLGLAIFLRGMRRAFAGAPVAAAPPPATPLP